MPSNRHIKIVFKLMLCCALAQPAKSQSYDFETTFSAQTLQTDFSILCQSLKKIHSGLYWHQSEKDFDLEAEKIRNMLNTPMTALQYYMLLSPFIATIKCDHTNIEMPLRFFDTVSNHTPVFPAMLQFVNNKIYIKQTIDTNRKCLRGAEILSINSCSADSLQKLFAKHSWADGFTPSMGRLTHEEFLSPLFLHVFNFASTYTLHVKPVDALPQILLLKAMPYNHFKPLEAAIVNKPLSSKYPNFAFQILDSSTALLTISAFVGSGYYTFIDNCFDTLEKKQISNLIIDVRNNGGGDGYYPRPLLHKLISQSYRLLDSMLWIAPPLSDSIYRYGDLPVPKFNYRYFQTMSLKRLPDNRFRLRYRIVNNDYRRHSFKPSKHVYSGKVFVLTNVSSSSAGAEIPAFLKYYKRAVIIGTETGGGYNGSTSGWEYVLTLPGSKLVVRIPMIKSISSYKYPYHRGVPPDYILNCDPSDLHYEKDSELLFTRNLIQQSKTQNPSRLRSK